MSSLLPRTRVEVFAVVLVLAFSAATWELFTAWGIMAASAGAQFGRVPQQALTEVKDRAQLLFSLMILCQIAMLASAVWFIGRKRVALNIWQCFQRPSNWLFGAGLVLVTDVLVFGAFLGRQIALAGR